MSIKTPGQSFMRTAFICAAALGVFGVAKNEANAAIVEKITVSQSGFVTGSDAGVESQAFTYSLDPATFEFVQNTSEGQVFRMPSLTVGTLADVAGNSLTDIFSNQTFALLSHSSPTENTALRLSLGQNPLAPTGDTGITTTNPDFDFSQVFSQAFLTYTILATDKDSSADYSSITGVYSALENDSDSFILGSGLTFDFDDPLLGTITDTYATNSFPIFDVNIQRSDSTAVSEGSQFVFLAIGATAGGLLALTPAVMNRRKEQYALVADGKTSPGGMG